MVSPHDIRRFASHEWALYRQLRLQSLADAPHAFGSSYAAELQRAPALWQARVIGANEGMDCPLLAEQQGDAVGLVWGKTDALDPALVHVYQLWVAASARGKGVGAALILGVIDWARANRAQVVRLAVTIDNHHAAALYRRLGFEDVGTPDRFHEGSALVSQLMQLDLTRECRTPDVHDRPG